VKDPYSPTSDEIEEWAKTRGARYPVEDWDLVVADQGNGELLVRIAADPTCINHDAVMNLLYVYAGQVLREGRRASGVAELRKAVDRAAAVAMDDLRLWAQRSTDAIDGRGPDPRPGSDLGDYEFWFRGGWRPPSM